MFSELRDGYPILYKLDRPEDLSTVYLTESHNDLLGWLIVENLFDFCQTLINAIEARELAAALIKLADELDANRDALLQESP